MDATIATIAKLDLREGDALIVSMSRTVSLEEELRLRRALRHQLDSPDMKIVVLESGMSIQVLRQSPKVEVHNTIIQHMAEGGGLVGHSFTRRYNNIRGR